MLEFARIDANAISVRHGAGASRPGGLAVGLARTSEEVEQCQRLRYAVFTEDLGAVFPGAQDGIDQDRFDRWCEHLLVRETGTGRVVGTYRILTPGQARAAGGHYSESEFDLSGLRALHGLWVEVGRSCIHADYRKGAAIMLLWSGLAEFLRRGDYRSLFGCASVSLRDGGAAAAEVWRMVSGHLEEPGLPRARPLHRYPVERLDSRLPARAPPLIKGYLKLGARVCGEPAWDPDFNTADFPVLGCTDHMDERYARHFGLR
jgi:putative hemolysin